MKPLNHRNPGKQPDPENGPVLMGDKANCYGERKKLQQHANPCLKNGTVTHPIAHLPFLLHDNEEKMHSKHQPVPLRLSTGNTLSSISLDAEDGLT